MQATILLAIKTKIQIKYPKLDKYTILFYYYLLVISCFNKGLP